MTDQIVAGVCPACGVALGVSGPGAELPVHSNGRGTRCAGSGFLSLPSHVCGGCGSTTEVHGAGCLVLEAENREKCFLARTLIAGRKFPAFEELLIAVESLSIVSPARADLKGLENYRAIAERRRVDVINAALEVAMQFAAFAERATLAGANAARLMSPDAIDDGSPCSGCGGIDGIHVSGCAGLGCGSESEKSTLRPVGAGQIPSDSGSHDG